MKVLITSASNRAVVKGGQIMHAEKIHVRDGSFLHSECCLDALTSRQNEKLFPGCAL